MRVFLAVLILLLAGAGAVTAPVGAASPAAGAKETYLYRVELVQAAPGKLIELIELYKARATLLEAGGDVAPFWMRHSQGDRWDLLLLYPMGSYAEYYGAERAAKRAKAEAAAPELAGQIRQNIAWQEDVFVHGPAFEALKAAFAGAAFFHVEMMYALPGKSAELYKEREMESAYQRELHRPELFLFVRDQGAAWDILSIDFYRDLKHYAENGDIPAEKQEAAARATGFRSAGEIGPNLRTLIAYHHDTLAVAIAPAAKR
jgi:hypothetical protein